MIKRRQGSTHDLGPNIKVKWKKPVQNGEVKKKTISDWTKKNA